MRIESGSDSIENRVDRAYSIQQRALCQQRVDRDKSSMQQQPGTEFIVIERIQK